MKSDCILNLEFCCVSMLLKRKISSTLVKYWMRISSKFLILLRYIAAKLKISFNYGEVLNEFFTKKTLHSATFQISWIEKFFIHLVFEWASKILHSGALQIFWIKMFLQPWWRIFNETVLKIFYCASKLKNLFNHCEVRLYSDVNIIHLIYCVIYLYLRIVLSDTM